MSQQAARSFPMTTGSNARVLRTPLADPRPGSPAIAPEKSKKARTPLSLVVSSPKRSSRSLMVILFAVVVTAMAVVLVMSISVSKGQYELVGLKNQQSDLYKVNQSLEQDIAAKQAPQQLVSQAAALGMVPAATTGQIDVRTKKVSGSPQPATADAKGLVVIPPARIDAPVVPVPVAAPEPLSPAAKDSGQSKQTKEATANESSTAPKKEAEAPAAPAAAVSPELNGGTIPAPLEKDD
ncbi:hypothetical protein SAMN04489740_0795 [Arthrobacter alpinus]|uniref:Cell division protein FtsL n=1 Tax=Arthrobacter alpinus TaxID=656366 RepID=A0A1H5GL62_9MICC|nr:hypothetical protein [Arthrobacter alpinus]SEE16506.1 hypothetical protein SAMN04489740_0795 [Arthrobacter alpinus]